MAPVVTGHQLSQHSAPMIKSMTLSGETEKLHRSKLLHCLASHMEWVHKFSDKAAHEKDFHPILVGPEIRLMQLVPKKPCHLRETQQSY